MRPNSDPKSPTFKPNVPSLCAKCHPEIAKEYAASIHGTALAAGKMDSPSCNDCHSEHSIQRPDSPTSTVFATHVSQTCASCHAAERITRRYGLAADRVATYRDSYHGLADLGGSTAAANCASCHGFHDVLPSSDPRSRISRENLLATCSRCHEGAGPGFIEGRVHAAPDPATDRAAWWVRAIYLVLIPVTIGGMLLHNAAIFLRFVREKLRAQRASTTYVRFRPAEVAVHATVALSFIVLSVTGFALAFPEAGWVRALAAAGMDEGVRGWLHRAAAVLFAAGALWHFAYVATTRHGRYAFGRMLPRPEDLRDARRNVAWHLGLAKEPPRFDRWDYTMKVEYWALVWGGLVMGVTGALLWFKVEATEWVPRWVVYVAERVHWYEAILAVLAILVWHFFFVIFHPAEYPMNLTFLTGRKTEQEMRHAHPAEYERLKDSPEYRRPPERADRSADGDAEPRGESRTP
jgi:cytochrome b subunit of formate dehydrogenase